MTLELDGRAALITGAGSGIGRALAVEAVARGMHVGISDIDEQGLLATRDLLHQAGATVHADVVDVREAEQVEQWAARSFDRFSSVAVVFSNAGLLLRQPSIPADLGAWNLSIDTNLRGAVHCLAAFGQRLVDQSDPSQLVVTGSQASFVAAPEIAAYCATKAAVWALVESVRYELAMRRVTHVGLSLLGPPRTHTRLIDDTLQRLREQGGETAVQDFIRTQTTPPASVAEATFDALVDNPLYILPEDAAFDGYRQSVERRMAAIFAAGA